MKKTNLISCLTVCVCLLLTGPLSAKGIKGVLEGEYVPVKGSAESMEVSRIGEVPNQLGSFKIKLERRDWDELSEQDQDRIAEKVEIKGVFRGEFNPDFTLDHTLANDERTGILYTQSDFIIPTQGDLACTSGVPLKGTEQLNFVSGAGVYAALTTGTIYLSAVVNNCAGQPKFLQYDFKVKEDVGALFFAAQ